MSLTRLSRAITTHQGVSLPSFQAKFGIGENLKPFSLGFALSFGRSLGCRLITGSYSNVQTVYIELKGSC